MNRIERERVTIKVMLKIYCKKHHGAENELCSECIDLQIYALKRIEKCTFESKKPVCAKCVKHCYKTGYRESIRKVMHYSGPKMILRHPYLAVMHLIDSKRFKSIIL